MADRHSSKPNSPATPGDCNHAFNTQANVATLTCGWSGGSDVLETVYSENPSEFEDNAWNDRSGCSTTIAFDCERNQGLEMNDNGSIRRTSKKRSLKGMEQKSHKTPTEKPQQTSLLHHHNTTRDQHRHTSKISNTPQGGHKNSDHILDQNAARKTGGPIVGPPVLRAQSVTRKWALLFRPCQ